MRVGERSLIENAFYEWKSKWNGKAIKGKGEGMLKQKRKESKENDMNIGK